MIRSVENKDISQIVDIYNYYIENTTITFEEETLTQNDMEIRIEEYSKYFPWLVYEEDDRILGYCYATKWRARSAYKHSAEVTVYVSKNSMARELERYCIKNY